MHFKELQAGIDKFIDEKFIVLAPRVKVAICLAAWLLPAALYGYLFFMPGQKELAVQEQKITKLAAELQDIKAKSTKLKGVEAELAETALRFAEASKLLPDEKEIPSLLTNVSSLGANVGLDIVSFQPKSEIPREFYAEIPFDLTVRGQYHNIGTFLERVSKLDRIVLVKGQSMDKQPVKDGVVVLTSTANFVTYRFIEPPAASPGDKKKKEK